MFGQSSIWGYEDLVDLFGLVYTENAKATLSLYVNDRFGYPEEISEYF